ncbi:MAG: ankyrin repeat domain-containing protein [Bacteroidetes bacterium]|nr:ankyrin repeat domain-containing protein [Fibrella sp.]
MSKVDDIFRAARFDQWENFVELIDEVDINVLNEYQQNLLHEATAKGAIRIAKELITLGINLNQQDRNGQTPLHYAALRKNADIAQAILKAGGNTNIRDNHGNNALWTAAFNARGDYSVVDTLLLFHADATTRNAAGRSPLDFASQINDRKMIELLTQTI